MELKNRRGGYKSVLTATYNLFNTEPLETLGEVQSLLHRIRQNYKNYDNIQTQIEANDPNEVADRLIYEKTYGKFEATILDSINEFVTKDKLKFQIDLSQNQATGQTPAVASVSPPNILPKINLEHFDGKESNWLSFIGIFNELIHNNKLLSNHAKLCYLRSCLKDGTAWYLVSAFDPIAENYDIAYKNLFDHYNNPVLIQKYHMSKLYEIKRVQEGSQSSLLDFVKTAQQHVNALKTLNVDTTSWDLILVHHLNDKLDSTTRVEVVKNSKKTQLLSFLEFINILTNRCDELAEIGKVKFSNSTPKTKQPSNVTRPKSFTTVLSSCPFCKQNHGLNNCPQFTDNSFTPSQRYKFTKEANLCINCLRDSHTVKIAHLGLAKLVQQSQSQQSSTILATAVVSIRKPNGQYFKFRALIDNGSQNCFVTENLVQQLKAPKNAISIPVVGINPNPLSINHEVVLEIASLNSNYKSIIRCFVVRKLVNQLPSQLIDIKTEDIDPSIVLADPAFHIPDKIDILLGVELIHDILLPEKIMVFPELPPFQRSVFGYIVMGKLQYGKSTSNYINMANVSVACASSLDDLNESIQRFWQVDTITSQNKLSLEEKLVENHFQSTTTREESGRYTVSLPLKSEIVNLESNYGNTLRQFHTLEHRLKNNPEIYEQYRSFIREYIDMGHMQIVETPEQLTCKYDNSYYIPHHAVFKENSSTTKLRVVFNASSKSQSNLSLNDCQMVGPTVQEDLMSIVIRCRKHPIALTADIAKMYRQINHPENERDLLRILWRDSSNQPISTYKLNTVTYGTASAPYLATKTLSRLAIDEQVNFPTESQILSSDFYVDDLLTGAASLENARQLKTNMIELLNKGGFDLRKWSSNAPSLNSPDQPEKLNILGLQWNTIADSFSFSLIGFQPTTECTKRTVLSEIAKLFDPLGLCAPIIFFAKLIMQQLWILQLSWDEPLQSNLVEQWNEFKRQISTSPPITVPRCVLLPQSIRTEIHGFGDASEKGYGCVIYLKSIDEQSNVKVHLVCSKSRIAPLKKLTIPRLELCASHLLSSLIRKVMDSMKITVDGIYLWTDSVITLYRIKSSPSKYCTFVANRISAIQDNTSPDNWYYVPTSQNPADLVSRGLMPTDILDHQLWWNGPSFLVESYDKWPTSPSTMINETELELRKEQVACVINCVDTIDTSLIDRYSSYTKLVRITSLIRRFVNLCRNKSRINPDNRVIQPITSEEIEESRLCLVKLVQKIGFENEIKLLSTNKSLPSNHNLKSLVPFVHEGLLRVGGRLQHANIPFNQQHQILLPTNSNFTTLVIRHEHRKLLHAGPQTLLYNIRLQYWIPNGRTLCRKIVHQCLSCFRIRPITINQTMGQLPSDRVNLSQNPRAFEKIGIDYCGPFNLTVVKSRSTCTIKSYIAVFVCFITKAVHLEIVEDLTTNAFIGSLRRFVSRRGLCSVIYSDNATNFLGAKRELEELKQFFSTQLLQHEILKFCSENNISWKTIPPRSPHFGGLWGAAVKSAKHHIKTVLGNSTYYYHHFHTFITQIEACLNSRPLTPMSNDPSDMSVLTPGHFIIGAPLTAVPDPDLSHLSFNQLSHYQKIQSLLQQFFQRWSLEYINELQQRVKWKETCHDIKIGTLVLLKEDNIPPMKWIMGRIITLHPGQDDKIRVVTIKTPTSEFKRSITKVCPLPIEINN